MRKLFALLFQRKPINCDKLYRTWSGYSIPFSPSGPILEDNLNELRGYLRFSFDEHGRVKMVTSWARNNHPAYNHIDHKFPEAGQMTQLPLGPEFKDDKLVFHHVYHYNTRGKFIHWEYFEAHSGFGEAFP